MSQAKRVQRDLTAQERAHVRRVREQVETEKEAILAKGRRFKAESDAKRRVIAEQAR